MTPSHLRLDVDVFVSRAEAGHVSECPEIGPICQQRAEPPQEHHTTLWLTEARLLGEFGLRKNLALQAMVPLRFVGTRTVFTDLSGTPLNLDYVNIHHRNELLVGLGDTQLLLHGALKLGGFQTGARLGVSLPTGRVNEDPFELGARGLPHQHIQFGTGTFDPVLGLDVSRDFGTAWSLAAFGISQLPLYQGPQGFQSGVRLGGGVLARSSLGLPGPTFRLGLNLFHEFAERWNGVVPTEDGNQGRTDLFLATGVTVPFAGDWSVSFDLRARVWGQVAGAQLSMPVILEVSLGRLFHLEGGEHHDDDDEAAVNVDALDLVREGELAPLTPAPGKWTLFDFWAPWCEACKVLDHELRELAETEPLALRRVNIVDFDSPIARRELPGVEQLPAVRLVAPDGQVVFQASGPADELLERVKEALRGGYTCPMHPQVHAAQPGPCPVCGMDLVPRRGAP